MRSAVFGILYRDVCVNYALCHNARSYTPLLAFNPKCQLSTMHLFTDKFHASFNLEAFISFRFSFKYITHII